MRVSAQDSADEAPVLDRSDMEKIASRFILRYFDDKPVPDGVDLLQDRYLGLVLDTSICCGVDKAYAVMGLSGRFESTASEHLVDEDIRYVIKTLSQIRKRVPAEFAAGVLLMHLEILEGMPL